MCKSRARDESQVEAGVLCNLIQEETLCKERRERVDTIGWRGAKGITFLEIFKIKHRKCKISNFK